MDTYTAGTGDIRLSFDPASLRFDVTAHGIRYEWAKDYRARIVAADGEEILFTSAAHVENASWKTGVGQGVRTCLSGFRRGGEEVPFAFETIVWVEDTTGDVFFEWIPVCDDGIDVKEVYWPGPMAFERADEKSYTLLNNLQGVLLPNTWPEEVRALTFDGQFCSAGAYMPWFGQVDNGSGYIAICATPWDAGYQVDHPAGGPYTHVSMRFLPSLGKMSYARRVRYSFRRECDYNDLCKIYRQYVRETGLFTTLAEKAAKNPLVDKLIGSAIVHKGIKTHVSPDSAFYDPECPEKNDFLVPFEARRKEILHFKEKGVDKLYLHLDGWGQPGYDNQHPDYLPACREAGGWEGFKALSDTMKDCGYMFGVHDQYRDYYFDAQTFDREFACKNPDGSIFDMARWAGGRQTLLCASQAPYYVKRNFEQLFEHGIHLEGTYLDVFTCNEPDECCHPWHRMTRRECLEYRAACFEYLSSRGILPSSEEVTDWSMKSLVFCHYGPYDFMLARPGSPRHGVPVPLFNLVYHDCLILPWFMDRMDDGEDYMLYALLNGGAAYLDRDGAYPNIDGAFDDAHEKQLDEQIARYRVVAALQEKVAKCEMVRHEFVDGDYQKQRTTFSDGTSVLIDLSASKYQITDAEGKPAAAN